MSFISCLLSTPFVQLQNTTCYLKTRNRLIMYFTLGQQIPLETHYIIILSFPLISVF